MTQKLTGNMLKNLMSSFQKFVSEYLFLTTKRNQLLILDRFFWKGKNSGHHLFLVDPKRKKLEQLHVPSVTNSDKGFKVVGSCDGLICVTHYSLDQNSTLFLWNPVTNQTKRILEPLNALLPYKVPPNCLIGFYFNYNVRDYEIVRVHSFEDTESAFWGDSHSKICAVRVEKYSLKSGLWREIECCGPIVTVNGIVFWTENSVTLDGTLFWIAMEVSEKVSHEIIIYFNSYNNVIGKIELPISFKGKGCSEVYKKLAVYKDSVAVLICSEIKSMIQCIDLWVLSDKFEGVECWIKVQTIGEFSLLQRPVSIWKNEVIMATSRLMHCASGLIALLPEYDFGAEFSDNVLNYVESFVPL